MTATEKKYGVQIYIRIPVELDAKLNAEAEGWYVCKAAVIRKILAEYFREKERKGDERT